MRSAFTLIELLVVITVIAILAALLFPVFSRAREQGNQTTCLSNSREIGFADSMYLSDDDGIFPETKDPSSQPDVDDAGGSLDEPDYGSFFDRLQPFLDSAELAKGVGPRILACPSDSDPFGSACLRLNPDAPPVTSYLVNGYLVFGLNESSVPAPSSLIAFSERRSDSAEPFCDYVYHPWFDSANAKAPEDQMDASAGAVSTARHNGIANYDFADTHAKSLAWSATFAPPAIDLHKP